MYLHAQHVPQEVAQEEIVVTAALQE